MMKGNKKYCRSLAVLISGMLLLIMTATAVFAQTPSPTPPAQCVGSHNIGFFGLGPLDVCAESKAQAETFATMENKIQNEASKFGRKFCKEQFTDCKCVLDEVTFKMNCSPNTEIKCKKGSGLKGFSCNGTVTVVKCRCS